MLTMANIFRNKPAVQPNRQQQQGPDVKSENIFLIMMKVLLLSFGIMMIRSLVFHREALVYDGGEPI